MKFGEITWQIVPNTVTSRMLDSSLTHKLISSRKIRQRTKAMNSVLKYNNDVRTYKQFVKMKTSILRKVINNNETDSDSSFTDDDYSIMHKSESARSTYLTSISKKNYNYSHHNEIDTDEDDAMSDGNNRKLPVPTAKTKRSELQRDLEKTSNTTSSKNVSERNGEIRLACQDKEKLFVDTFKGSNAYLEDIVLANNKVHIADKVKNLDVKSISTVSKEMVCDLNSAIKGTTNSNQFAQSYTAVNEISHILQAEKNHSNIVSDSVEISIPRRKRKKDQVCITDNTDTFTNQNFSICQNDSTCLSLPENAQVTPGDDDKSDKRHKIRSPIISNFNHPKDSGIEEDTDGEPKEQRGKQYNKVKHKRHKPEDSSAIKIPGITNNMNSTDINETLKYDNGKLLNEINSEGMAESLNQSSPKEIECNKKMVTKPKLEPKVTCMETIRQKYKIITCNKFLPINTNNPSPQNCVMQNICNELIQEREEIEDDTKDAVPPSTKKRLSQLRRLNLTIESDSSSSDNEDTKCVAESMRDKLLQRSTEYSESPSSEDISARSDLIISMYGDKKFRYHDNSKIEKCKGRETLPFVKKKQKHIQNDESFYQTSFSSINIKNTVKNHTKAKHASSNADNIIHQEPNLKCDQSNNFHQREYAKELDGRYMENINIQKTLPKMQNENQKMETQSRPYNLQELIEDGNLMLDTRSATFTLEDIGEHDLFIIDIPSVVFNKQLVGSKIVLTKRKLKLGKQKYNVEYKNVDNVSCVFVSKKSDRLYKTVNVKPFANIVAHQRM